MYRRKTILSAGPMLVLIGAAAPAAAPGEAAAEQRVRSRTVVQAGNPAIDDEGDQTDLLRHPVRLDLVDAPLESALEAIARRAGLALAYDPDILPAGRTVTLRASALPARDVLARVLNGTGLEPSMTQSGQLTLARRPDARAATANVAAGVAAQSVVTGTVTDAGTGEALPGAEVRVDASELSTVTDTAGRYTLDDVPPGTHTLVASMIGYRDAREAVIVTAGTNASLDFALTVSAVPLDQMIVTGTMAPTQVRAVPTPVSVITAMDIKRKGVAKFDEILRSIPGVGVITRDQQEYIADVYVRGATTFAGGTVKTYIDGVEIANPVYTLNQIDPASIERVEMIRGPQASTLYGSEAISGVLQIFTKKGHAGIQRPRIETTLSGGGVQSHYKDGLTPFQGHDISITGSEGNLSYNLGASYNSMGEWIEDSLLKELGWDVSNSARSDWGFFAGARYVGGSVTAEFSARVLNRSRGAPLEKSVTEPARSGRWNYAYFTKPSGLDINLDYQTYGLTLSYDASGSWRHQLTIGDDENVIEFRQPQARRTTPADTLLLYRANDWHARSLAYRTAVEASMGQTMSWNFQAGFDRTAYEQESISTSDVRQLEGGFSNQSADVTLGNIANYGFFLQVQTAWQDQLFLTTGLRTDGSSGFGDDHVLAWSPRVGIAHVLEFGSVTVKARASYGTAIRPPEPQQKLGRTFSCCVTVANDHLAPEAQSGYDLGVDLYVGSHLSLGVTRYDQEARDMIQLVRLSDPAVTPETRQYQNVGRIKNTGWEIEATASLAPPLAISGHWSIMNSTVKQLSPTYTGTDLVVGERPLNVPRNTGAATISYTAPRIGVSLTMSHKGSWQEFRWTRYLEALVGTDPDRDPYTGNNRDYIDDYPAVQRFKLNVTYDATSRVTAMLNVDNLLNDASTSQTDIDLVQGRQIGIGARIALDF